MTNPQRAAALPFSRSRGIGGEIFGATQRSLAILVSSQKFFCLG